MAFFGLRNALSGIPGFRVLYGAGTIATVDAFQKLTFLRIVLRRRPSLSEDSGVSEISGNCFVSICCRGGCAKPI